MDSAISINFFLLALLICSVIACLFFILLPASLAATNQHSINSFRAYFIVSSVALGSLILRPYIPLLISVFLTNALYVLATYSVLIGLLHRYQLYARKYLWIAGLNVIVIGAVQVSLAHHFPDYLLIRIVLIYINVTSLLVMCLGIVMRFKPESEESERVLAICVGVMTIATLLIPAAYFASRDASTFLGVMLLMHCTLTTVLFGAFLSAVMLDNIYFYQKTARIDPLTGIYNRRHFFDQSNKFLAAAERHHFPISIVICDLDLFKQVNDTYGHSTGDKVLSCFVDVMLSVTREEDIIARLGGEEFVALLPQTSLESASLLAERLREKVASTPICEEQETIVITASFGVASLGQYKNIESGLRAADKALYRAKRNGRNRVEVDDLTEKVLSE